MALMPNNNKYPEEVFCIAIELWGRIHEWGITYVGLISRPDITELRLGPSENAYRQMSVIVVLEVSACHTGFLVTKCWAKGVICPASQSSWELHKLISKQCVDPTTRLVRTHYILTIE